MNKACRDLRKKNNEREQAISKENDEVYTDMLVYLRCADITQYNQELVREDIIELILDGQQRGDDIAKVMGSRYKEICDEIIDVIPKRTKIEKVKDCVETSLCCLWIIGGIYLVQQMVSALLADASNFNFTLTIGNLVSAAVIIIVANVVVEYVCKTALKEKKSTNKVLSFIMCWGICFLIFAAILFSIFYLTAPILEIPMIAAALIVGIIFVVERFGASVGRVATALIAGIFFGD